MLRGVCPWYWFGAFAVALFGCAEADRASVFDAVSSPRGDYTLNAIVIEPWFPQGAYRVRLDLVHRVTGQTERLVTTNLAYDGVAFTRQNIGVRWTGDSTVLACLRATDRPDQGIQITLESGKAATVRHRTGC